MADTAQSLNGVANHPVIEGQQGRMTQPWYLVMQAIAKSVSGGAGPAFGVIRVSAHPPVIATVVSDILTLVAGTGITLTTSPVSKSVTIDASGSGTTPGGSDTQAQYNDAGAFGGTALLTFQVGSGRATFNSHLVIIDGDRIITGPAQPFLDPQPLIVTGGEANGIGALGADITIKGGDNNTVGNPGTGSVIIQSGNSSVNFNDIGTVTITTGSPGVASNSVGTITIQPHDWPAVFTAFTSGNPGGPVLVVGGPGQPFTAGDAVAGHGGGLTLRGGIGGAYGTAAAFAGNQTAGAGGPTEVSGGAGGNATGATGASNVGGAGGDLTLKAGLGGTGTSTNGVDGRILIQGGRGVSLDTSLELTPVTVSALNASPLPGMIQSVSDATAPAWGVPVVGGGAAYALVTYNGSDWTVVGV